MGSQTLDVAVTIPNHVAFASTIVPTSDGPAPSSLPDDPAFASRYSLGDALGEGGMGVVRVCADKRIGREVAIKTVRAGHGSRSDLVARFLREACVQGQLEHPSVVPVYDLGRDPDGRLYFTMKRVHGLTFEEIVTQLRDGQEQVSRRKLLTAFASVCQAVHCAHTRGVVHRDLKPGNVMLGDFGEVYVLDWGLAKIATAGDPAAPADAPAIQSGSDPGAKTLEGAAMGTPGYMAPEQARGEGVDARADVYALGAILFELLAREPLHTQASIEAAMASTLAGVDAHPSARRPHLDVAPELDAICARATALSPGDRFSSARELVHAVERFLDGDRDLELRRDLARDHADAARACAERALSGAADSNDARSAALRDVGRALALDPDNADAARTLIRLFTEPPREAPPEVRAELANDHRRDMSSSARVAGISYLTWFLYGPFCLWMGIASHGAALVATTTWAVAAVVSFWAARNPQRDGKASLPMIAAGAIAIATTTTIFGPYFLLPGIAAIETMTFVIVPPNRARQKVAIAAMTLAVVVPAALSWIGVLPQPYSISGDAITIRAVMIHFPAVPTEIFLLLLSLATVITAGLMVAPIRHALTRAEERLQLQAWQLKQLLPREAHVNAPAPPPGDPLCLLTERRREPSAPRY